MKITIGKAKGNQRNICLTKESYENFKEFSKTLSICTAGCKHSSYFIRGGKIKKYKKYVTRAGFEYRDIYPRINEALKSACLLVIDGDKDRFGGGAPKLKDVHEKLVEFKINHCGYTTHSHSEKQNKWRVCIPCELLDKTFLEPTITELICRLNKHHCDAELNTEMKRWTSAWFYPTRDDPEDGLFEFYEYHDGSNYKAIDEYNGKYGYYNKDKERDLEEVQKAADEAHRSGIPDHVRIAEIQSGKTFHDHLLSLSWGYSKDGMNKKSIVAVLQGVMQGCAVKDERWKERFDDIERIVDEGAKKQNTYSHFISAFDNRLDDDVLSIDSNIPMPPGLFGKLVNDAYNMSIYQYKEVAVVSALGLVAGICGRKFNINQLGLNVYLTLIMNTGMGKDSIRKFITRALNLSDIDDSALSFLGPSRFTGPKGVNIALRKNRSIVCVFTEAGILLKSTSGDSAGLSRTILGLYSQSGDGDISNAEQFSSETENIVPLASPSMSIINEATPETLLSAFRDTDALASGHVPRQTIIRVNRGKPYPNMDVQMEISEENRYRLKELVEICLPMQKNDKHPVVHIIIPDDIKADMKDFVKKMVDLENNCRINDPKTSMMASRAHVKALKFAAICSIYNNFDVHNDIAGGLITKSVIMDWDSWKWAKDLETYELEGVQTFFSGSGINEGGIGELIGKVIGITIIKMFQNKYANRYNLSKSEIREGVFPKYRLTQLLKNNIEINTLNDPPNRPNPRTGCEKVIDYMIRQGLLYYRQNTWGKNQEAVKESKILLGITDEFKIMMEAYLHDHAIGGWKKPNISKQVTTDHERTMAEIVKMNVNVNFDSR